MQSALPRAEGIGTNSTPFFRIHATTGHGLFRAPRDP